MSRTELAAAFVGEPISNEMLDVRGSKASIVTQRRLQEALADLGPGRPLPPPPRPSATSAAPDVAERTSDEIVRALAGIADAKPAPSMPAPLAEQVFDSHPDERPPMVIERAIAAKLSGIAETRAKPSVWPGLATGFALALAVGGGLYYSLTIG